jgi:hypothetical protein
VNTIKEAHKGNAIDSLRISPDGSFFVSGGDINDG